MTARASNIATIASTVLATSLLSACGGGSGSSTVLPATTQAVVTSNAETASFASAARVAAPAATAAPNYVGYVSWFWGDQSTWTINCDKPSYFSPNTCLPVHVKPGVKQLDGPPLAVGVFVAMYADPATANGTTGLTAQWFRTSKTPFAGSTLPKGYVAPVATPTPTPGATAKPTAAPTIPPPVPSAPPATGSLPSVFSQVYSSTSPFHTAVAQHKSNGATILGSSAMNALWSQGATNYTLGAARQLPIYTASASDPLRTIACTQYGGKCQGSGTQIHVPTYAAPQSVSDAHIIVVDPANNVEWDGWQCKNGSTLSCSWGALYTLGGSGLHNNGSDGVHAGYAAGLFMITPQEILNGHIDHALGLNTQCLNNPTVYPADQNASGSDQVCGGSGAPAYGNLVHLVWTPSQIAASAYSAECKTILTALATYGAYTYDTGNLGLEIAAVSHQGYTSQGKPDPWVGIKANMRAAGDADSSGNWRSCLNRLSAADLELIQIRAGTY